ncbi:MAG: response regulator transcription factor [Actinomycetota bacterium]
MNESARVSRPNPVKVLVCDDDETVRTLLGLIIELRPSLQLVGKAADGHQAILESERLQPDVILLDLSMPRLSGLEALPDIKRVAPGAKVIVLSGFSASVMAQDALDAGADRYVEKGAHPESIAIAIEQIAARINDPSVT